jgi:hypothetical protein
LFGRPPTTEMDEHTMRDTPARHTDQPGRHDPTSPGPDLPATIVRGALAVIFGCGATVIFLLVFVLLLGLFLG